MSQIDPAIERKAVSASVVTLAEHRQVRVVVSTPEVDRSGDIVVQEGVDLTAYRANPVVLWMHDPNTPIATCIDIKVIDGKLTALVQFPPEGEDEFADLTYRRIKNGVVNTASIGFMGAKFEAVDPKNPPRIDAEGRNVGGGKKFISCELGEFSFVSIPAVRGAVVTERSGFVSIDAAELAALRTAAAAPSKLAADFRQIAKTAGKGMKGQILHLANLAEQAGGAAPTTKKLELSTKSLWHLGYLASALRDLGWIQSDLAAEAVWEGDGSELPAVLADIMRQLGAALIAVTAEEVGELLAHLDEAEDADGAGEKDAHSRDVTVGDVAAALQGKAVEAFVIKAGRVLSRANEGDLSQARDLIDGVLQKVGADADEDTKAADHRSAELRDLEIKLLGFGRAA